MHDNLTSLPNRQLFYDRLEAALTFASQDDALRPTVVVIDLDKFKQVNESVGHSAGDSILLTLSRRLGRLLKPQDTLARVAGDEFAVILLSEREPDRIIAFADMIRRAVTTPITYAEREIFLTGSIGLALHDPQIAPRREEVLKNAEIAMVHAKRQGGDRIEVFRPTMRSDRSDRITLESDLQGPRPRRDQGAVQADRAPRGPHDRRLRVDAALGPSAARAHGPEDFLPLAEETGLIVNLSVFLLERTARELAAWQDALEVEPPIFASSTCRAAISCGTISCTT